MFEFSYSLNRDDLITWRIAQILPPKKFELFLYYLGHIILYFLLSIATYIFYEEPLSILSLVFLILLVSNLFRLRTFSRTIKAEVETELKNWKCRLVKLIINSEGLYETSNGVVSSVEWESIKDVRIIGGLLDIELPNQLRVLIPERAFASKEKVHELLNYVRRNIEENT